MVVGIFYGFSHQRTIYAQDHAHHAQAEWKQKEDLIQKAKLEWKKKQNPSSFTQNDGGKLHTFIRVKELTFASNIGSRR